METFTCNRLVAITMRVNAATVQKLTSYKLIHKQTIDIENKHPLTNSQS